MKHFSIYMLLAAILTGACTNSITEVDSSKENDASLPHLTASCAEQLTRTYVENNRYLHWHEADMISVFNLNEINAQYRFEGNTGDTSGSFSATEYSEFTPAVTLPVKYALYPYQSSASISSSAVMSLTLPSIQEYAHNSFGKGANTMIAVSENAEDTHLKFKNACGYLKIKLYGQDITVSNIVVKGNNSEKIAGEATATTAYGEAPVLTMGSNATRSVTLTCNEGVELGTTPQTATEFWVVLPVTTFTYGITIEVNDMNGGVYERRTSNPVSITRNEIQPMATLEIKETIGTPKSNQIWYTSSNDTAVTPFKTDGFGASIVSNTYAGGKGIITFDNSVTSIGREAFEYCSTLSTITLPESVVTICYDAFAGCSSLAEVNIPANLKKIESCAFSYCSSLSEINIGSNVSEIESSAFAYCSSLNTITVDEGNTYFDSRNGCNAIIETASNTLIQGCAGTVIPESVTAIGEYGFNGFSSMTEITIPSGVTSIGEYAFSDCTSLASVFCKPVTPPTGGMSMFNGNAAGRKIYVPENSVDAYKEASGWTSYADDITTESTN